MKGRRYRRIVFFFARVLLSVIGWEIILPRLGLGRWSASTRPARMRRIAMQYRQMAVYMGGVLIKVGQFLSSRVDVLPEEITSELSGLQDEVPPEPIEAIRQVAEAEFGATLDEKYLFFDETPLAAASLGQVHKASLRLHKSYEVVSETGEDVIGAGGDTIDLVVKVQRPNIEQIVATDLAALRTVGRWIRLYPPIKKRMNVMGLFEEFSRTLYEEMDYLAEGRNAETFANNFKGQPGILVPKVIWTHTTKRVLTLENVEGIKITNYEAISASGVDRAEVASRLLDTYLQQIFIDGFFHADPHPGNLFVKVLPDNQRAKDGGKEWQLTFVDFGMVGRIPAQTRAAIRELLIGVGTRDAAKIIKSYQMLGVLLPGADVDLLERASEEAFNRFWGKNMAEMTRISVAEIEDYAREFRDLVYDMPFQVPQDIIFLFRAVGILSGMCTGLDPNFNLWVHLAPFAQQLIAEEMVGQQKNWLETLSLVVGKLIAYPRRVDALMDKLEKGHLVVQNPDLVTEVRRLKTSVRHLTSVLVVLALLLVVVQFYLGQEPIWTSISLVFLVLSLLWLFFHKYD